MPVIAAIVEQHAVESAFIWFLRNIALGQPNYSLADIVKLDSRLDAHLDGLRIAGDDGWNILQEFQWEDPGEVFAAGVLALECDRKDRIDKLLEIAASAPELERGIVSALGWVERPGEAKHPDEFVASNEPALRRIGLAGYAVRRQGPEQQLVGLLKDEHPRVRARALKAVGELGRRLLLPSALQALRDEDDDCRFYAACTAIRFAQGDTRAVQTLIKFVEKPHPRQRQAVSMAVRGLDISAAKSWLNQLGNDGQLRLATIGTGVLGDPEFVEILIHLMKRDDMARVAGESFSMITGVDLSDANLERERPEGFESGPTEDPADENVAMDEDENLPWPDAELVAKWWSANGGRFQAGRRYLCGREISVESARQTLIDGKQRQRAAAAMELAMLQPHQPLFEVRARGAWQQAWLAANCPR